MQTTQLKNTKSITERDWLDIQHLADEAANELPNAHVRMRARARFAVIERELNARAKTNQFSDSHDLEGLDFIHLTEADWNDGWSRMHDRIGEAALNHNAKTFWQSTGLFVSGDPDVTNPHLISAGYDVLGTSKPVDSKSIFFIVPSDEQPVRELTPQGPFFNFDDFEHLPTIPAARTAATSHASRMSDYVWEDTTGLLFDEPQAGDDMLDWYCYC